MGCEVGAPSYIEEGISRRKVGSISFTVPASEKPTEIIVTAPVGTQVAVLYSVLGIIP